MLSRGVKTIIKLHIGRYSIATHFYIGTESQMLYLTFLTPHFTKPINSIFTRILLNMDLKIHRTSATIQIFWWRKNC